MRKICIAVAIALTSVAGHAFSLLGPFPEWMGETNVNGMRAIGGPMSIGEEYRWNLPLISYGFDQAFLTRFGLKGARAVEAAMNILNRLPAASDRSETLDKFPFHAKRLNLQAAEAGVHDLGSAALVAVLEQLGVGDPVNNMYTVRDFILTEWYTNALVILRNFDPVTFAPSSYVNNIRYAYELAIIRSVGLVQAYARPVDPTQPFATAVAGSRLTPGEYFSNLSRDDVGALYYLLAPANRQIEDLSADVRPLPGSTLSRRAYRPGVNKLTFVPIPLDPATGQFGPTTFTFKDSYIDSGILHTQLVQRTVTRPDILFSADDLGFDANGAPWFQSSPASRWINNAALNSTFNGLGPGVIPPGATILFNRAAVIREDGTPAVTWGSFDGTTNAPITLSQPPLAGVNMVLIPNQTNPSLRIDGESGIAFDVQISTNLSTWTNLFSATNFPGHLDLPITIDATHAMQFYRVTLH